MAQIHRLILEVGCVESPHSIAHCAHVSVYPKHILGHPGEHVRPIPTAAAQVHYPLAIDVRARPGVACDVCAGDPLAACWLPGDISRCRAGSQYTLRPC
jgi:hypothetical protein